MKKFRRALIEITNVCNLRCAFCAPSGRAPGYMPLGLFESAAAQAAELADMVSLHLLGEPFMHPELPALLAAASRAGLKVNLVTNGTLLARFGPGLFSEKCLRQVTISLQALSALPEERRPALLAGCAEFARSRPAGLIVGFRLRGAPGDAFVAGVAAGLCGQFGLTAPWDGAPRKLAENTFLNHADLFSWRGGRPAGAPVCLGLRHHFGVLYGGEVVPCCADFDGALKLGNIKERPLAAILNSPEAAALRRSIAGLSPIPAYCAGCGFLGPS